MLSFFRKKNEKIEKKGSDSVVDSQSLLGEQLDQTTDVEVKTQLSYHPDFQIGHEERYYFQFLHNELPSLKQNQISISGIEIKKEADDWHIIAFVRNGLSIPIRFEELPLLLIGANGEILARKEFDLSQLGEIPAESSRPWIFDFHSNEVDGTEMPEIGWMLSFETKAPHYLDLDDSWRNSLSPQEMEGLKGFVDSLGHLKLGEVNFTGMNANRGENGDLHVTLLIRNGHSQAIHIEKLPLIVEDASGEAVATGLFTFDNLEVQGHSSKPLTFIFPANLIKRDEIDLSTWRVFPQ